MFEFADSNLHRVVKRIVTCCVLGTMVNQMKNQTVDIKVLIY